MESFMKVKLLWSIPCFSLLLKCKELFHIQEFNNILIQILLFLNLGLILSNIHWYVYLKYWWVSLYFSLQLYTSSQLEMPFIPHLYSLSKNILDQIIPTLRLHMETIKVAQSIFYVISALWNFFLTCWILSTLVGQFIFYM